MAIIVRRRKGERELFDILVPLHIALGATILKRVRDDGMAQVDIILDLARRLA